MSRSGYSTDIDCWDLIRWRGQVASAIRGKRGQALLKDLLKALDDLPEKRLISEDLVNDDGEMCALGVVGKLRGLPIDEIDPEDHGQVAKAFDIAEQLAQEIVFENDEAMGRSESPEKRFERMRRWTVQHLATATSAKDSE